MSRNILTEIRDNLDARNELYDLLDKPYYVDSIKYKFDDTTAYLDSSSDWIIAIVKFRVIVIVI